MSSRIVLLAVLAVAAALRFWNISAGLPYRIGPDEPVIAEHAIGMMRTGNFNPRFYDYPGLVIYVQLFVGCVTFVIGAMSGLWRSVSEFHPEHLFLWTRMLNASIGTLTVLILYSAGMRWGRWVALMAAALLAVWPNHVRESHFALTDVPLTFLTTSTFLLSLRAYESGRLSWWLGAGVAAGLASASKYSGAYAVMLPVIAAAVFHASAGDRLVRMAAAVMAAGLAFLIAAPYTVLDLPRFLNAFAALSAYYRPRPFGEGAIIYLLHIRAAIGLGGLFAIAFGLVWGTLRAVRGNELRRWALVVLFPLAYFYAVATKHLIFARYLLPAVPLLCLIIAIGLVSAAQWVWGLNRPMRTRAAVITVAVPLMLFPIVRAGITWPLQYGHTTTQDIAYARIRESIPYGSGVAVERSVLRLPDSLYRKTDVPQFTVSTPEQHIARGSTFLVASSDAFGPVLDRPSERAAEHAAYRRLFDAPGHCLPAIEPTAAITGPRIIICRLDSPIQ